MAKAFHPPRGAVLLSLAAFVVLIGLGTWQVERLKWKTALLAEITQRMQMKPRPMPEKINDPEGWEYRRVTLAGHFLYDHEFLLKPRVLDGVSGYHMVVPFQRASGGIVMVNRGWISDDLMPKVTRPQGIQQVEGILQLPHTNRFTPANNPQKNDWYWPDAKAMAATAKLKAASPLILMVAKKEKDTYPVGGKVEINIANNHKLYAIFWYLMAFISQVIFILRFREKTP